MPKYTFECHTCRTRFDRTLKMEEHPTHPCPKCKEEAPRLFTGFGFQFSASATGKAQANTGVHDLDHPSADKIVGRSAEERWAKYRERDKVKKAVRSAGGPALARVDGDGFTEYAPMDVVEKKAREKLVDYAVDLEHRPIVDGPKAQ